MRRAQEVFKCSPGLVEHGAKETLPIPRGTRSRCALPGVFCALSPENSHALLAQPEAAATSTKPADSSSNTVAPGALAGQQP